MIEDLEKYDVILILGNYGAGKSHLAKEYFANRKRVNRHEIRHHLVEMMGHGERWNPGHWDEDLEGLVKHMEYDIIIHYLGRNEKLVIDNTSLTKRSRKRYIDYAKKFHRSIACVFLNRDISLLLKQNKMREYAVPEHIIIKLHAKTEIPDEHEGFNRVVIM